MELSTLTIKRDNIYITALRYNYLNHWDRVDAFVCLLSKPYEFKVAIKLNHDIAIISSNSAEYNNWATKTIRDVIIKIETADSD